MNVNDEVFERGVVNPVACFQAGWRLIQQDYWLFLGMAFVGTLIGGLVPMGILMAPMMCGIYLALLRRLDGEPVTFDMLFQGFNYFVQGLIAMLLTLVPFLVLIPVGLVIFIGLMLATAGQTQGGPPNAAPSWIVLGLLALLILVFILVSLAVSTAFIFVFPLIVDRKLSGWDAAVLSAQAAYANRGGLLGLIVLNFVLSLAGAMACCIGQYFVMPVTFAALIIAYRQVFPLDEALRVPVRSAPH